METTIGSGMGLLIVCVIGGVIGWLASLVMKTNAQMGIVSNIVVGIVGAWLGGWLASLAGIGGGALFGIIVAVAGACVLIMILRAVKVFQ